MCKVIPIKQYLRTAELRDDYYEEVRFHTNKYIKDCQMLYKLKKCIPFPFKTILIRYLKQLVINDKACISHFTSLYCLYNTSIVQSI